MAAHSKLEILKVATKLGLTSFGGPVAHLGYFREEYVRKRGWLDERSYADLVALCQFLPGPASSKVGIGIGLMRGGLLGAVLAWIGFTLPSVIALVVFAYLLHGWDLQGAGWIHGLKLAAVAIVTQAVWGMGKSLTPDRSRATIAILTAIITLVWSTAFTQIAAIAAAGLVGLFLHKSTADTEQQQDTQQLPLSKGVGSVLLLLFIVLLLGLPFLRSLFPHMWGLAVFDSFYRAGALVFGGGHVVLPLLEQEVVPSGWMTPDQFLAGYGAVQAVPGPLFTFAAYLGTLIHGWLGALIATIAIFTPAFLLTLGALPFWNTLRRLPKVKQALWGINAAVVGILLAALYDPVWTSAVRTPGDFSLALLLFGALMFWKLPPWIVVVLAAAGGTLLGLLT
ncbi:chromate transporter [Paenibacillus rigui]|uniref:ChrA protein n=1 Tax=Paenibacillus rigui TaxID=554312 RepID=A0A229UHX2_9BACL|nr:chromate transporter [Paenibacillus rigui]OXM82951.1 ChrA protein [Paenibacillus rigui]